MNKELKTEMEESAAALLQTVSSFTDEQFNQIPFEGSWTGGQVAEHLLKSNVTPLLYGKTEKTDREPDKNIKPIKEQFLNFNVKMKNPDFNTPSSDNSHDKKEIMELLTNMYRKAGGAADSLDLTQTCLDFHFPNTGYMTRLELLHFMLYHTQRHTHQMKNILEKVQTRKVIQ